VGTLAVDVFLDDGREDDGLVDRLLAPLADPAFILGGIAVVSFYKSCVKYCVELQQMS
jgi:hypothetical protein